MTPSELYAVAADTRRLIEPGLQKTVSGTPNSTGSCLHATLMLAAVLRRYWKLPASVRGGGGDDVTGALDVEGRWRGHYWLDVEHEPGSWVVVDITGDQFGQEAVRVIAAAQAGYLFRPGSQADVDAAAAEVASELGLLDLLA